MIDRTYARERCPRCDRDISVSGWDGIMKKHGSKLSRCYGSDTYPTLRAAEREKTEK